MSPVEFNCFDAYPAANNFMRESALFFGDVRALMEMPKIETEPGQNFTTAAALCNLISGFGISTTPGSNMQTAFTNGFATLRAQSRIP